MSASDPHSDPSAPSGASPRRGVCLPVEALHAMVDGLGGFGKSGAGVLRESGRVTGAALCDRLDRETAVAELPTARFWHALNRALEEAGLGTARYRLLDGSTGSVLLTGSPEARGRDEDRRGSGGEDRGGAGCHFAAGWIGGVLTRVAGEPVSVMEVRCGNETGDPCRFLVGSYEHLSGLHRRLRGGASLDEALRAG